MLCRWFSISIWMRVTLGHRSDDEIRIFDFLLGLALGILRPNLPGQFILAELFVS